MPKDYKNVKNVKKEKFKSGQRFQSVLPFLTGLTIGLFVAFIVYLNGQYTAMHETEAPKLLFKNMNDEKTADNQDEEKKVPPPEFDFYTILPKMEVNVSEWVADKESPPEPVLEKSGVYILQAGSFKEYRSADEVKAKLALMGIKADIQQVVINGRDIRHRVRVGPYKDTTKLHEARKRLIENKFDFILLKLEVDE